MVDAGKIERDRRHDAKRRSSPARALYFTPRWRKERAEFLKANPYCALHARKGERVPAKQVNHTVRHRGDPAIFWDRSKWEGLCDHCHNSVQQKAERGRFTPVGLDGWPVTEH